jgi:hypothetical protein
MESASSWPRPGRENASSTRTVDPNSVPRIRPPEVRIGRAAPRTYMAVIRRLGTPRERAKVT